jgi:branched-chain amino acid transport system permease protein
MRYSPVPLVHRWWGRQTRLVRLGVALSLLLLAALLPMGLSPYWQGVLFFPVGVYVLLALGLNIVVGQAGLLDLGYVAFYAVGAYTTAKLTTSAGWTAWEALVVAVVLACVAGVVLGAPTLRLRGDYLAIVTLGFGEIIRLLADNVTPLRGQSGFERVGTNNAGQPFFDNATQWYWLTVTIIVGILLLVGNLERSRVGRAWVAIREDEDVAEIMGVATYKFKIWAFVIGAAIGGLSGALYAGKLGFVNNQSFDVVTSMLFLAAVVLGGAGNKVGVLLGAVVVAYLPLRFVQIAQYNYLIFGIALIVLMIFRPQGLLGARQRLLAKGRQAYQRLVGRGDQPSGESALATEPGRGS